VKIIVAGVDGYIGFALAQRLLNRGHEVLGIDCFLRRKEVDEMESKSAIPVADWRDRQGALEEEFEGHFSFVEMDIAQSYDRLRKLFEEFQPDTVVNLAQQPSPAYSMIDQSHANFTQVNNVKGFNNLAWCMKEEAPESHMVTVGTMGEWGYPNVSIPEGFFRVERKGREDILPFPKQANSFYHVSKIQTSDNAWFLARVWELKFTDVMQGIVYGSRTREMDKPELRTRLDMDEAFGTFVHRICASAIAGHPIPLYGSGKQKRPFLPLKDSVQCLELLVENPPTDDDSIMGYRVVNQLHEWYSLDEVAEKVVDKASEIGIDVQVEHIENPRIEKEIHHFEPEVEKLPNLGYEPSTTMDEEIEILLSDLNDNTERVENLGHVIEPEVKWR